MIEPEAQTAAPNMMPGDRPSWIVGSTSLFFVLLQSACTAFMAISGLRLAIGIGSLGFATSSLRFLGAIHGRAIRTPMEILAVAGSLLNLYAVWRIRSLRSRPSSQWRVGPTKPSDKRAETIQIALATVSLLLLAFEWFGHLHFHRTI